MVDNPAGSPPTRSVGGRLLSDKAYLGVVLPFMLSTITQPLMGAVDTAMMGHLSDPAYISGVALGAVLFNSMYWLFGFLRVGTTGYSAQALGSGNSEDRFTALGMPLVLALVVSLLALTFQEPILHGFIGLIKPEARVAAFTAQYFSILIWGAPFVLFNYVALGWLMGQARLRASLFMQISTNLVNIVLCVCLVHWLGLEVRGVATATLIAQVYGCLIGFFLLRRSGAFDINGAMLALLLKFKAYGRLLAGNGNLFLRTACLLVVNNMFAAFSTGMGTEVLAANAVLLQVQGVMSYLIDGMANGNSLFVGRAVGRQSGKLFEQTRLMCLKWLAMLVAALCGSYALFGGHLLTIFSSNPEVVALAAEYGNYVAFYPLCAGIGISFYGMYTGAMHTAPIRDMMFLAMLCFASLSRLLVPAWGNDGLWLSYLAFYGAQTLVVLLFFSRLRNRTGFIKRNATDQRLIP